MGDYSDLYDHTTTHVDIECNQCGATATEHQLDTMDACASFYTKGWRHQLNEDDMNEICCPDCAKFNKID